MSNAIFPTLPGVKKGSRTKTPIFKTQIQESASGRELRTSYTSYPRWQFALAFEYLRAYWQHREWQILLGFFMARGGSFDSWLFLDPDDCSAENQQFGVGDGETAVFRFVREMEGYVEPIAAVVAPPEIYLDGVLQESGYTVDQFAGMITFDDPPTEGVVLRWTGAFYYRCRFLQDKLEISQFMKNFWQANKVEFISIKP